MGYASDQGGGLSGGPLQEANATLSFCEHCAGQRFDRAQVLRVLRDALRDQRAKGDSCAGVEALVLAINNIRALEIPHLEMLDDSIEGEVIH